MTLTTSSQATELACGTRTAAVACVDVLREAVSGLDPDVLLDSEAPEVWSVFDAGEKLCAAAKTLVARKVEDSGAWKDAGMRSAAGYLALRGGTTREAARDSLKTSRRVANQPHVQDALRRGELSGPQAHAIADAADHDPACASALLDHAKTASFKELRDECLRRKAAADPKPEDTRDRIYKDRRFRLGTDPEGAWCFSGRGPLDHAGIFSATLNPLIDEEFKKARAEGRREERHTLAYDALQEMARLARGSIYGYDPGPTGSDNEDLGTGADDAYTDREASGTDNIGAGDEPSSSSTTGDDTTRREPAGPASQDSTPGDDQTDLGDEDFHDDDAVPAYPGRAHRGTERRKVNRLARQPNPSHLGLLRVDLTGLRHGDVQPGKACEVAGLGPVPIAAARELLDQSIIKLVISDSGGSVVNVTHIGHGRAAAQRLGTPPLAPPPEGPQPPPTHVALVHVDSRDLHAHPPEAQPPSYPTTPGQRTQTLLLPDEPSADPNQIDELCTIPGIGPVPEATACRLLGPSLLDLILTRGVMVAGHVHKGRKATVAQRMALLWAQPECSVLGCPHTFVQIDHRLDWAKTHVTRLEALDRLCVHHHQMKTHQGWALVPGTGKRPMVPPDDPHHPLISRSDTRNAHPSSATRSGHPRQTQARESAEVTGRSWTAA